MSLADCPPANSPPVLFAHNEFPADIIDFFKTTPRIVPRGPQKKKASKYPIQIMVKNLLGKTLTLKLNLADTIDELKTKMQEKDGHQREEHYLQTLGGQRLDENRTLADYNIQAGQTLLEMGRLLGGAREAPTTEDNIESIETQSN